jgi:hypothetical protein
MKFGLTTPYKIYHSRPPKYEILATPLHAHTKKERVCIIVICGRGITWKKSARKVTYRRGR